MITKMRLANRLRLARENANLTQEEVATALKVPRTAVTQVELGNRHISTLELARWAEVCRKPIIWFFEEEKVSKYRHHPHTCSQCGYRIYLDLRHANMPMHNSDGKRCRGAGMSTRETEHDLS